FPSLRHATASVDHTTVANWVYVAIGQIYPVALQEPAHISALGHSEDAFALRHFIVLCLIWSLTTVFVYTGPGYPEFIEWTMLNPNRMAAVRGLKQLG